MLVREYNKMMEAKGAPKVWVVDYSISCPGTVHSKLFLTEEEAKAFFDTRTGFREMYRTWDIWNFTERERAKRHGTFVVLENDCGGVIAEAALEPGGDTLFRAIEMVLKLGWNLDNGNSIRIVNR